MITTEQARKAVDIVLEELNGRGGFDHFWDSVDKDIQEEIKETCASQVHLQLLEETE